MAHPSLAAFLEDPARPDGTLRYHELQGFIFTVVSAPELIGPSEWMPIIFGDHDANYETLEDAQRVVEQIMVIYNNINAAVLDGRPTLPADCEVCADALENLEDGAPLSQWARGFLIGHQWLEELWEADLPEEWDEELGAVLMTLSFFASRRLAEAFSADMPGGSRTLGELARVMVQTLPDALGSYANLGRTVMPLALDLDVDEAPEPRRAEKVGRNEPCPCGSGKKFKKCCGLAVP